MTAQTRGEFPRWLSDVIKPEDAAVITDSLGLPRTATAKGVAHAIATKHNYSFTPYGDGSSKPAATINEEKPRTGEWLALIAQYANNLRSLNCNVSFLDEIVATRGSDGKKDINGAVGFHNDSDKILSQAESHQWGIDSKGHIIDATPSRDADVVPPPAEAFKPTPKQNSDPLKRGVGDLALVLMSGFAAYAYRRYRPSVAAAYRSHQYARTVQWLGQPEQGAHLRVLKQLLHAPPQPGRDMNAVAARGHREGNGQQRLGSLPILSVSQVDDVVAAHRAEGVTIPDHMHTQLRTLAERTSRAKKQND